MPRRRCVGCGRSAAKPELVRVALAERTDTPGRARRGPVRAVIDAAGTLPGRGAYLCRSGAAAGAATPDPDCLQRALRRGGLARTLRRAVELDLPSPSNS
jgi:predicted RNA-binding protein YlxR (DUF448 family)